MDEFVVVAEFEFKPGRAEEGFELLERIGIETQRDDGCGLCALHRTVGDPQRAVFVERWDSRAEFDAHTEGENIAAFEAFDGVVGPPRISMLEPAGVGDPELGRV